jgi:hypothetical protein
MRSYLAARPWIWVLIAFVAMIAANVALLVIAERNPPVPL